MNAETTINQELQRISGLIEKQLKTADEKCSHVLSVTIRDGELLFVVQVCYDCENVNAKRFQTQSYSVDGLLRSVGNWIDQIEKEQQ